MTCAATGPLRIRDVNKISGPEGGEVFSEQKGLNLFQNKVVFHKHLSKGVQPSNVVQQEPQDFSHTHTTMHLQTLRVRRVYDQKHNTLVYTAYATRFQNSVSTVTLPMMPPLMLKDHSLSLKPRLSSCWHAHPSVSCSVQDDGPSAGRYRTSVCALPISPAISPAAAAGEP